MTLGATVRKLAALVVIDLAVLFVVLVTINSLNNKSPTSKSAAPLTLPNQWAAPLRDAETEPMRYRGESFLTKTRTLSEQIRSTNSAPEYSLHFDQKGSVTISCATGPIGIVVGFNAANPSSQFLSVFGGLALDTAGVNTYAAIDAALMCHQSALRHKGPKGGLFFGDHVDKPALHIDCRAGNSFTSFGLYHP